MKTQTTNLNRTFAFCALLFALCIGVANGAVVSRTQRPTTTARISTISAPINATASNTSAATPETESPDVESETEIVIEPEPEIIIEDKTSQFDEFMADSAPTTDNSASTSLAAQIRAQRAALDAADAASATAQQMATSRATGHNACDAGLRACMQQKCGNDYSKCARDTDTMWGTKMDACRRDTDCTGREYAMLTAEIRSDRDMNARISSYNAIIDCGNRYNDCIATECGHGYVKCLGKRAGDAAISKCAKIANECKSNDSGLASRTMNVFGTLRVDAETQVAADEKRLYELRDAMRDTCDRLGAMFDERTLDCVYTVNFFAGDDNTLYASKKAYAGSMFSCEPTWFGVDITTFRENAYRATREQTSATSGLLGAGVGIAAGAITSGAIDRAIDRHNAEVALDQAQQRMDNNGKTNAELRREKRTEKANENITPDTKAEEEETKTDDTPADATADQSTTSETEKNESKSNENTPAQDLNQTDDTSAVTTDKQLSPATESNEDAISADATDEQSTTSEPESDEDDTKPGAAKRRCTNAGGKWSNNTCTGADCGKNRKWDNNKNQCVKTKSQNNETTNKSNQQKNEEKIDITINWTIDGFNDKEGYHVTTTTKNCKYDGYHNTKIKNATAERTWTCPSDIKKLTLEFTFNDKYKAHKETIDLTDKEIGKPITIKKITPELKYRAKKDAKKQPSGTTAKPATESSATENSADAETAEKTTAPEFEICDYSKYGITCDYDNKPFDCYCTPDLKSRLDKFINDCTDNDGTPKITAPGNFGTQGSVGSGSFTMGKRVYASCNDIATLDDFEQNPEIGIEATPEGYSAHLDYKKTDIIFLNTKDLDE